MFVQLAQKAREKVGIDTHYWHVESPNFSVEGCGFAKDKRFELKQVTIGLITCYKTAIPRYMETFDGKANDKHTLVRIIEKFVGCFAQNNIQKLSVV